MPDADEPWQQQSHGPVQRDSAEAGPVKGNRPEALPHLDVRPHQEQNFSSKGLEAPRPLTDLPAAVPARRALSQDTARADSGPAVQTHDKAEAFPAAAFPDSLAMDTSTLQELTALPSAHGRIPVSLKSPLPMATARPLKGRGMGRLPGAITRSIPTAKPSPAREAAGAASRQSPLRRAPGTGSQSAGSRDDSGKRRMAHPATRKQLHFDEAGRHALGKSIPNQKGVPGSTQGSQGLPNQQAKLQGRQTKSALRGSHQKLGYIRKPHASSPDVPRILHGAASSDSNTPRVAAAWLPQPAQQAVGFNPLYDSCHGSGDPEVPGLHCAQPAGIRLEAMVAAQSAGMTHASARDPEAAPAQSSAAGVPQQLHQGGGASVPVSIQTFMLLPEWRSPSLEELWKTMKYSQATV